MRHFLRPLAQYFKPRFFDFGGRDKEGAEWDFLGKLSAKMILKKTSL